MESLKDPGFPSARERGNFRIWKRVTSREMSKQVRERSSRSLRGEGNEERGGGHNSRGSNLNSVYLGTEYKYL